MSGAMSFTLSPDQKGIETGRRPRENGIRMFTLSPDQKGIETANKRGLEHEIRVHTEPRSKGD
mgnify:CR=1 FL=1